MEADTGQVAHRKSSSRDRKNKRKSGGSPAKVPLVVDDDITFKELQRRRIKVLEKRIDEEVRKRRKDFDKECEKMKEEFLLLYPEDKDWGSEELISDPMVLRRRGSMDILDAKTMQTLMSEFFEPNGMRFKLMFDVSTFDQDSVHVQIQSDLVKVTAIQKVENDDGTIMEMEFSRKIQRPMEISANRFETWLTQDGILVVEAPLPPQHHHMHRISAPNSSPSHSVASNSSTRSQSPTSPQTPTGLPKIGLPIFTGKVGERRLSIIIDMGDWFKPQDILVQVCNSTNIEIKAKTESRNTERSSKSKFFKLIELGEKIVSTSLRAGLMNDGKLVIGALGKPEKGSDGKAIQVPVEEGGFDSVVDLAADYSRIMNPEPPAAKDDLLL